MIIISGAGGGYDIFGGMLIYNNFKKEEIILFNLSFTSTDILDNLVKTKNVEEICYRCYKIYPGNYAENIEYFPEYKLANKLNHIVYAMCSYEYTSEIKKFYDRILPMYKIDSIYLIDGGCDILLKGNEGFLGTPVEDMMHLKVVKDLNINDKYVCAIGMNVDCGDDVIECELIKRIHELENRNIIQSEIILNMKQDNVKFYLDTFLDCNPENSLVHCFIYESLINNYGYIIPSLTEKIKDNKLVNISELTKTFIKCDLLKLANSIIYLNDIKDDMNSDEVDNMIRTDVFISKLIRK